MTCGQQQTVNGKIVSAKCILTVKHSGPHTDGNKQWSTELTCNCFNQPHDFYCPLALPYKSQELKNLPIPKGYLPAFRFVQIAANEDAVFALDMNGCVWACAEGNNWRKLPMPVNEERQQ